MAFRTKVGSFNTGTGAVSSTVAVTGVGFQPKAILFWWTGQTSTTDAVAGTHSFAGYGVAVSPTGRGTIYVYVEDATATSNTDRAHNNDACVAMMGNATNVDGLLDLQSMDADGFTLVVDDQFSVDMRVHYMAFGGDELTNVAFGTFTEPGATGTQDYTTAGFQPDCVFLGISGTGTPPYTSITSTFNLGIATAASSLFIGGASLNGSATPDGAAYCRTGAEVIAAAMDSSAAKSIGTRAAFSAFLSNGFRLNWTERSGARPCIYLALKGGSYAIGSISSRTDTNNISVTGLGFRTTGILFASHCRAQSASDVLDANWRWSLGATDTLGGRVAAGHLVRDTIDPSQVAVAVEHDSVYVNISDSDTIDGLMDLVSIDQAGFTTVMTNPDPSAAFITYLAVGNKVAPPPFQRKTRSFRRPF